MILTCPECATSYFVDDSRIPPGGRMVKCTSCEARWRVEHPSSMAAAEAAASEPEAEPVEAPQDPAQTETEPEAAVEAADPPTAAESEPAAPAAEASAEDLEISGPDPHLRRRRPPPPAPAARKSPVGAVVAWSLMAATVAALVAGAIVFRGEVVKLWPKSSGAYAGIGLPVNSLGLVIEQVKVQPTFQGGRPVLSVTGQVRNVADHAADSPPIRIDLLDKAGETVAAKIARPLDGRIPAGARRHFAIAIIDPPSTARDLQVAFEAAAQPQGASHAIGAEAAHGPTPAAVEAQPLPADSPDALQDHG